MYKVVVCLFFLFEGSFFCCQSKTHTLEDLSPVFEKLSLLEDPNKFIDYFTDRSKVDEIVVNASCVDQTALQDMQSHIQRVITSDNVVIENTRDIQAALGSDLDTTKRDVQSFQDTLDFLCRIETFPLTSVLVPIGCVILNPFEQYCYDKIQQYAAQIALTQSVFNRWNSCGLQPVGQQQQLLGLLQHQHDQLKQKLGASISINLLQKHRHYWLGLLQTARKIVCKNNVLLADLQQQEKLLVDHRELYKSMHHRLLQLCQDRRDEQSVVHISDDHDMVQEPLQSSAGSHDVVVQTQKNKQQTVNVSIGLFYSQKQQQKQSKINEPSEHQEFDQQIQVQIDQKKAAQRQAELEKKIARTEQKKQAKLEQELLIKERSARQSAAAIQLQQQHNEKLQLVAEKEQAVLELLEQSKFSPYQNFISEIERLEQEQKKLLAIKSGDKKAKARRNKRLQDIKHYLSLQHEIYDDLQRYAAIICDQKVTDDKLLSLLEILKQLLSKQDVLHLEEKHIAWYISLYPEIYQTILQRYQQLKLIYTEEKVAKIYEINEKLENLLQQLNMFDQQLQVKHQEATKNKDCSKAELDQIIFDRQTQQKQRLTLEHLIAKNNYDVRQYRLYELMNRFHDECGLFNIQYLLLNFNGIPELSRVMSQVDMQVYGSNIQAAINSIKLLKISDASDKDELWGIFTEQYDYIYMVVSENMGDMYAQIGLSQEHAEDLLQRCFERARNIAERYAQGDLHRESLEYYMYQQLTSNPSYKIYSSAVIHDVIRIQMMLIHIFARNFHIEAKS